MKKMLLAPLVLVLVMIYGCSDLSSLYDPEFAGQMSGKAMFLVYTKVSANKDQDFKNKVNKFWASVNEIKTTDDLNVVYNKLDSQLADILQAKGLSKQEVELLLPLKNDILARVQNVLNNKFAFNDDGLKFLIGFRDGVNSLAK